MRLNRARFFVVSSVPLVLFLAWQNQITLKEEQQEHLQVQIEVLNEVYEETLQDLNEVTDEKETLFQQLHEALIKIEKVEQRNTELELILFNQRQTYRTAVALQGSIMPALTPSGFTEKMYERAWSRLGAHGLKGTGATLASAEEKYGVNSLIIAAIAYVESGGGMSKIARDKKNLFGLGAGDVTPYASALYFSSKNDSIYFVANLLRHSYLSRGGRHYRGDNLVAINIRYASDPNWAEKVGRAMARIARAACPEGR